MRETTRDTMVAAASRDVSLKRHQRCLGLLHESGGLTYAVESAR